MYFITIFEDLDDNGMTNQCRCIGWKKTFIEANKTVSGNWGDIFDNKYNYAIIEYIPDGINQIAKRLRRSFYKFDYDEKMYMIIEEPYQLANIRNFAMGMSYEECEDEEEDYNLSYSNDEKIDASKFDETLFGKKVILRRVTFDGNVEEIEVPASIAHLLLEDNSDNGNKYYSARIISTDTTKWDHSA